MAVSTLSYGALKRALLSLTIFSTLTAVTAQVACEENTYDYIVVGTGPGGGPLAAELAKANYTVLLLEAGDDRGDDINQTVAGLFNNAFSDEKMRWDFFVKNFEDDALNNQSEHLTWRQPDGQFYVGVNAPEGSEKLGIYYPRTGTLGGCATHNAMAAALPSDSDWNDIAEITGDDSWTAENMRQYFIKLENNRHLPPGTPGHGFDGYLDITLNDPEVLRKQPEYREVLQAAAQASGQTEDVLDLIQVDLNNDDPDRDTQTGIFGFPFHKTIDGRRVSSRDVIVDTINATNEDGTAKYPLTLQLDSLVTKVLFADNDTTVTGVEYLQGKHIYTGDPRHTENDVGSVGQAYARREVIISGGTFNTPQILKLSGIGPAEELQEHDIPVVVDLPGVGANLQDNYESGYVARAQQNFTVDGPACTFGKLPDPCLDLWYNGTGPYTVTAFDALMYQSENAAFNERDLYMWGFAGYSFSGYWPPESVNEIPVDGPNTFDFSMIKIHPRSSAGTVTLRSADPRDTPEINFRFFNENEDADLDAMVEGIEFAREILGSVPPPLGPFEEAFPCKNGVDSCDTKQRVKVQAWSHHATSSCAIGADDDPMAVLDSNFRVRGTSGLRVVDASAFPRVPGAFPVLPTFIISEKAAAVIIAEAAGTP